MTRNGRTIAADVAIVGGGIAGASLAAVLARAGVPVVVVEREARFRDRVRGEGIHPWGYCEARRLGLEGVLVAAGAQPLPVWQPYADREPVNATRWDEDPANDLPELGVHHPRLQEAALAYAAAEGARVLRPAAARGMTRREDGRIALTVVPQDEAPIEVVARLLVGADGRTSVVRGWLGAETTIDEVHHRFGGALLDGLTLDETKVHAATIPGGVVYIMPQGAGRARVYIGGAEEQVGPLRDGPDGRALLALLREKFPTEGLETARLAGPLAFFPNADIFPDRVAGEGIVLIGDAAGANDPSVGQGVSLVYRDVRELSDLLLASDDWDAAIAAYAARRGEYYAVLREYARWIARLNMEEGPEADARRAAVKRAREADPTLGGFAFMYTRGPDGLVTDEAARAHYFGEDLPALVETPAD